MRPKFQAGEDLNGKIIAGLLRRELLLDFQTAKNAGTLGLNDREVLATAARGPRLRIAQSLAIMRSPRRVLNSVRTGL